MSLLAWHSFRGRFLIGAALLGLLLFAIAITTDRLITRAATRDVALADENRRLQAALDRVVWALQHGEENLFLFVLDPMPGAGTRVREALFEIDGAIAELAVHVEHRRLPALVAAVAALEASLDALDDRADELLALGNDIEQRFPGMPLVRYRLYPASQRFLRALGACLSNSDHDPETHEALLQLRHYWTQQIMQTRLFIANRFGVYGAPDEAMQRNLHDRLIYVAAVQEKLQAIEDWHAQGRLGFEHAEPLADMKAAAREYEAGFAETARVYESSQWRRDLPLMRNGVAPALLAMWHTAQEMNGQLDRLLESGLVAALERSRRLGYTLWSVSALAYLLLLAAYLFFEKAIRRPLFLVASALEAEGRGAPPASLPAADTAEVRMLYAAFEGMRRQVRSRQLRLETILANAHDGIITLDENGHVESFNNAVERLFGYPERELIGASLGRLVPDFDERELPRLAASTVTGGEEPTFPARRADGETFRMSLKLSAIDLQGRRLYIALVSDVTERVELLDRLRQMATYDTLTGLYNRRHFMDELARTLDRAPRGRTVYALLYIDLDNFKYVNDTLGHLEGDRVLVEVTKLLKAELRKGDLLARLGGDEFALLLHEADEEGASIAADRFRGALADYRLHHQDGAVDIGCSIGIATLNDDVGSREEWLARADLACHIAKQHGRNRCHLYRMRDRKSQASMTLDMGWSHRLKQALTGDGFVLVREPTVRLASGGGGGCSLRLQLSLPGGESIGLEGFLSAARRFGLLSRIDAWAAERIIAHAGRFGGGPYTLQLSEQSLGDRVLLKRIARWMDAHHVTPNGLRIELSEPTVQADLPGAHAYLLALRALGCCTGVCRFGSAPSALQYLRDLPVTYVKLDPTITDGLADDRVRSTMVQAIHSVVSAMGKRTVVVDVSEERTREQLLDFGIDCAEGPLFGKGQVIWPPERGAAEVAERKKPTQKR